jgi:tetratricopeptide (TPR) repeat protein
VSFPSALDTARKRPSDPEALAELARSALREGEEDRALAVFAGAATRTATARTWQWKGLLERSIDEHGRALESFAEAARLSPEDGSITHGHARVALEAGVPAECLFEQARRLAPSDGSVLIGLAAARLAAGHGEQAEIELDAIMSRSPMWIEGHNQLAQLRAMLGKREHATASLERAIRQQPQQSRLWQALFDLKIKRKAFEDLEQAVARASTIGIEPALLRSYKAIAASELGKTEEADGLFAANDAGGEANSDVWKVRHLLRSGRVSQAISVLDRALDGAGAVHFWPYAELAWRLTDDSRSEWLTRAGRLVSVIDLTSALPPLDRLAHVLRSIHMARGEYLDQSVRGGTQTDGPLFSRIEPEIRALRVAVTAAIDRYVAKLPEADAKHPLLSQRRDRRVRFAGSWSVRLKAAGFHTSHVHPQGWISSALYIALPPASLGDPHAGWLHLGKPGEDLGVSLLPLELVEPKPARLVLFPSWMWHGTESFAAGERLTVAFDVSVPRGAPFVEKPLAKSHLTA